MTSADDANALWQMDRDHFIHPYTDFSVFKEEGSQVISRASGVYVTDAEGKDYLDCIAGLWCVNIGHGREDMADVIRDQVLKMQYYNPFGHSTNEPASALAARLAAIAPADLNHVFFSSGGSTANDTAVRLAHYYFAQRGMPQKTKVISRIDGYHGSTYFAASLTGIAGTKIGFNRLAEDMIHHVSAANMYRRPNDMNESAYCDHLVREFADRIEQLGADSVAAFIAEPIMGAGGVLIAPQDYHRRVFDICRENDILYIADEVVTGFGRIGEWFVSEQLYGYQPDILVTAKGISSGYIPLGATLISDRIYEEISRPQIEGGALTMGFTYSGHAVACAAALKNIEILERENILQHVRETGPCLLDELQCLKDLPIVGDLRGSHFMVGIELVADRASKTGFDATAAAAQRVFQACRNRGVIVRPVGNVIVLSPPLIFSRAHCHQVAVALSSSIEETTGEFQKAGLIPAVAED